MFVGNAIVVVAADLALKLDGAAFAACDYDLAEPDDYKRNLPVNAIHTQSVSKW